MVRQVTTLGHMTGDTYTVTRSTTIDAPPARVYDQIANFRNWIAWSPWEGLDPDLKRTYAGADDRPRNGIAREAADGGARGATDERALTGGTGAKPHRGE